MYFYFSVETNFTIFIITLFFEIILYFLGFFFGFWFFSKLVFKNYKTKFARARGCIALYPFSLETFLSCSTLYVSLSCSISCFVSESVKAGRLFCTFPDIFLNWFCNLQFWRDKYYASALIYSLLKRIINDVGK